MTKTHAFLAAAVTAASIGLVALSPPSLAAPSMPPAANLEIGPLHVTAHGSGCPSGAKIIQTGPDIHAQWLGTPMIAQTGPGSMPSEQRRFCQLSIFPTASPGHQVGVMSTTTTADARITAQGRGSVSHSHYIQGQSNTITDVKRLRPGHLGLFTHVSDGPEGNGVIWAPCDEPRGINVKTVLTAQAPRKAPAANWVAGGDTTVRLVIRPCH